MYLNIHFNTDAYISKGGVAKKTKKILRNRPGALRLQYRVSKLSDVRGDCKRNFTKVRDLNNKYNASGTM